jgi:autotransporter-associated beta strand protein
MGRVLRFLKWATQSERRGGKQRQGTRTRASRHRRLVCEALEVRTLLSVCTWSGASGTDQKWSDSANWVGGVAPVAGDSLSFPTVGSSVLSPVNDLTAGTSFASIDISGSGYTLGGNAVTLQGGLTNEGSNNAVNLNLVLGASQEFENSASVITIGGNINLNGKTLTVGGSSGDTDLNGVISGTGGLIALASSARVVLAAANTYQGTTQVVSGTLAVSNATGLGAADGKADEGVILDSQANLEIDGPLTIANKLLTVAGSSSEVQGSVYGYSTSSDGVNDWTGGIDFAAGAGSTYLYFYAESGSLEVDGNIIGGSNSNLVPQYGPMTLKGPASSVADLYSESSNSVVVDGSLSLSNMFYETNGTTTEVDGTLTCAYGDVSGTLSGTGTVATSGTDAVYLYSGSQVAPGNASGPGTLTAGNFNFQSGSSFDAQIAGTNSYSQLQVAPGDTLTLNNAALSVSVLNGFAPSSGEPFQIVSAGRGTISGTFSVPEGSTVLGGNGLFAITYQGGAGKDNVVLSSVPVVVWSGGGSNAKCSDGANWIGGNPPVAGDNLIFPALGTAQSPINDAPTGTSFGFIGISGSNYTFSGNDLTLTGGVVSSGSGNEVNLNLILGGNAELVNNSVDNTLVVGGNINLGGNTLTIGGANGETDLNGIISGAGGLIASTSGKVVLSGNNSYQGTTQILSGTLAVSSATALGAADGKADEGTTLSNQATLEIDGPLTIANELLTVAGSSSEVQAYLYGYSTTKNGVNDWTGGINYAAGTGGTFLYLYAESGSLEVDGNITGGSNSNLVPQAGSLTLKGPSSSAAYLWSESSGSVVVDGSLALSDQFYDSNGTTTEVDGTLTCAVGTIYGTLSGTGTVAAASTNFVSMYSGGQVVPGNASGLGTLTAGNFNFQSGSSLDVQIASASSYGQLQVAPGDTLTLGGGNLSVSFLNGFTPAASQPFQIVSQGSGTISGTFAGLAEGSTLSAGDSAFEISYHGGAGHDVVLTTTAVSVWNGADGSSDTNWSDGKNWVGGIAPSAGANLIFPALSTAQSPTNDFAADTSFASIAITGSNYTLGGNAVTITSGVTSSGSGNTVNLDLALAANQQITNSANAIFVIGGDIDLGDNTMTIADTNSSSNTHLTGVVSGSGGLIVLGNGNSNKVLLAGANTYQGTTQIVSGTLAVSNATGLGAADGDADEGTILGNQATLEIDGPLTIANELLTVSGSSSEVQCFLDSNSTTNNGVNDWTGGINYASGTGSTYLYFYAESGSLEVDGNITGGANSNVVPQSGPLTLKGPSSSVGYLWSESSSTVVVDGSLSVSADFYDSTATTTEVDGTLTCAYGSLYGTLSGTGTVATSGTNYVGVYSPGQVVPGNSSGPGTLTVGNFTFESGSSLDAQLAGANSYSQLQVAPGNTLTLGGANLSASFVNGFMPSEGELFQIISPGSGSISGTFSAPEGSTVLGSNGLFTITYAGGAGSDNVVLTSLPSVVWSGGGGSNVNWTDGANWVGGNPPAAGDNLIFPALNTAQNPANDFTDASFGFIGISGSNYTFSGNALTLTGGAISTGLGNTVNLNITFGANGQIANDSSNTFIIGGDIDLGSNTLTIGGSNGETDFNGVISGAGGLVDSAGGKVVLSGSNSYEGTTQILAGTLAIRNAQALGAADDTAATGTILENGATLEIDGPLTIANELLTIPDPALAATYTYLYSYDTAGSGGNVWTGDIDIGSGGGNYTALEMYVQSGSLELDGNITGDANSDVDMYTGPVILKGADSSLNAFNIESGSATVVGSLTTNSTVVYGTMEVDGTLTVNGYAIDYGTMSGTGTISTPGTSALTVYGRLAPGNASGPGILRVGNVTFYSGSSLNAQLDGSSPGTFGQLQVAANDNVYLSGGSLNATLASDFMPAQNETFDIIQAPTAVSGTFSGLTEAGTFTVSDTSLGITYVGGAGGTDVQLTATSAPAGSSTISGAVYDDLNSNGSLDPGEPSLQGWTVYLDDNGNGTLDPSEERAITDANGDFSFTNLGAGTYTLREVLPANWVQTQPGGTAMSYSITLLGSGDSATGENFLNAAVPYVVTPASATPSTVTGTTTALAALGADADETEPQLTYTWAATTVPSGVAAPSFSPNGTNAARNITATFSGAGTYGFTVTIANAFGQSSTSSVTVTVNQTLTSVAVSPSPLSLTATATQQFTATADDQFGNPLATQPAFNWSTTAGTIDGTGFFTPASGSGTVEASVVGSSISGSGSVMVIPVVAKVSPAAGPLAGGTPVTITGAGFTGATEVDFGTTKILAGDFTVSSDGTQITVASPGPESAGTADVKVTTAGGVSTASSADDFSYVAAPTVATVSPAAGPLAGGTPVTITGTGFTGATEVDFGAAQILAGNFTVSSDGTQITVASPGPESAGTVDVKVTTAGGVSATSSADDFSYVAAPMVAGVSPAAGPLAGGTPVTITGTGFTGATEVDFGAAQILAGNFTVSSDGTQITVASPGPESAGTVDVKVTTAGGVSTTSSADDFTYTPPPAAAVTTPTGSQSGNVTISYTLMDADSNPCSIQVQYSLDGGATWTTATAGSGGDGATGLSSSPGGTSHAFVWASASDIANVNSSDVMIRITPTDTVATAAGTAAASQFFTVDNQTWSIVGTGDFSGDGRSDVLWESTSGDVGAWMVNSNGTQSFTYFATVSPSLNWKIVGVGDFNGNGTDDVLWRNTVTGDTGAWMMHDAAIQNFTFFASVSPALNWTIVGVGDFNGDGTSDVLWRNTVTGDTGAWMIHNAAIQNFTFFASVSPALNWMIVGVGDFNGDGTSDVLWRNTVTGDTGAWMMHNAAIQNFTLFANVGLDWNIVGVGDFNGDGTSDVLWQNNDGGTGAWFMQNSGILRWNYFGIA